MTALNEVRLTIKSKNRKVGPMPVSTTEQGSCPDSCPMKQDGTCYAMGGPLAIVWKQVSEYGMAWDSFCDKIEALPVNQEWRHDQAGDLPHNDQVIDQVKLAKLVKANKGKKGFTYTHHDMKLAKNRQAVRHANNNGFTVNLSADNLKHADKLAKLNIAPVVVVLPESDTNRKDVTTPQGRKVSICPAVTNDNVSCKSCMICQKQRAAIIGFPAHGMRKNKLSARL